MLDAAPLIAHWGYWAVFGLVILGNIGFPVPEEGILVFAGYLVWATLWTSRHTTFRSQDIYH